MATRVDLKSNVCVRAWKRGWTLKSLKTMIVIRITPITHNGVSDLKMYLLTNLSGQVTTTAWKRGSTLKYLKTIFNDNRLVTEL